MAKVKDKVKRGKGRIKKYILPENNSLDSLEGFDTETLKYENLNIDYVQENNIVAQIETKKKGYFNSATKSEKAIKILSCICSVGFVTVIGLHTYAYFTKDEIDVNTPKIDNNKVVNIGDIDKEVTVKDKIEHKNFKSVVDKAVKVAKESIESEELMQKHFKSYEISVTDGKYPIKEILNDLVYAKVTYNTFNASINFEYEKFPITDYLNKLKDTENAVSFEVNETITGVEYVYDTGYLVVQKDKKDNTYKSVFVIFDDGRINYEFANNKVVKTTIEYVDPTVKVATK